MSLFEDAMAAAVQLPLHERERLARALGLSVHSKSAGKTLPLNQFVTMPTANDEAGRRAQSAAWQRAEAGHAVVDTARHATIETIPEGAAALLGLWRDALSTQKDELASSLPKADSLPRGSAALVHSSVCFALAAGDETARQFFTDAPVEIRLATATYLALLSTARSDEERTRVQKFVAPYAVLSLGPMASSRAVELVISAAPQQLQPLDALAAATALAHEIPMITGVAAPFQNIGELQLLQF